MGRRSGELVLEVGGGELQLPAGFVQSTAGIQSSEDEILNEEAERNERQQLAQQSAAAAKPTTRRTAAAHSP